MQQEFLSTKVHHKLLKESKIFNACFFCMHANMMGYFFLDFNNLFHVGPFHSIHLFQIWTFFVLQKPFHLSFFSFSNQNRQVHVQKLRFEIGSRIL